MHLPGVAEHFVSNSDDPRVHLNTNSLIIICELKSDHKYLLLCFLSMNDVRAGVGEIRPVIHIS